MKKVKKSQLDTVEQYKKSCNELAELVNQQLFDGCRKWYWIGDDVGGVCDFYGVDGLEPEDMLRISGKGLTDDE